MTDAKIAVDPAKPDFDLTVEWTRDENGKILELPSEGIYFNVSEKDYHDLPYFSRSFGEVVHFDNDEAKHRLKNPKEPTPAMRLGTAIHTMLLEPEKFATRYVEKPKPEDFPGKKILFLLEDLKEKLKAVGEKVSGNKPELIARLKPYLDPKEFLIWDEVESEFKNSIEGSGKEILSEENSEILRGIKNYYDQECVDIKEIFATSYSEVTLIWRDEETGVMCKARLDCVRCEAIGEIKSFSIKSGSYGRTLMEILHAEIKFRRYNLQFSIYQKALSILIQKIKDGKAKVFGEVDPTWLETFLKFPEKQFFIVFTRTQAPFQIRAIEMEAKSNQVGSETDYFSVGTELWRKMLTKHANNLRTGTMKEKEIHVLDDTHVPNIFYQLPTE